MIEDGKLDRTLTLQDLIIFGVSSALGSGGFNLIGKAVRLGGNMWPMLLGGVATLFMGVSWVYSRTIQIEGTNTAETDIVDHVFGSMMATVASGGLLTFHIFAIAVSLVFVSHLIIPTAAWASQVGLALIFLCVMTWFSLSSIEISKELIIWTTWALLVILFAAAGLGGGGGLTYGLPRAPLPVSIIQSIMYFVFIFAGAEVLVKFARESFHPRQDIPIALFASNSITAILTLGVAAAIAIWAPGLTADQDCNALGHVFARFAGDNMRGSMKIAMGVFVLVTTFIMFLATTRYLYGLGEKSETFRWLTDTNAADAPWKAVAMLTVLCFLGLLINNTDTLVKISDSGMLIILGLVSAATAIHDWWNGRQISATVSGLTTTILGSLLGASFFD